MSYRIGHQCFLTLEDAHDYLLSQQSPTITQDGVLLRPVKKGAHWYLNGQQVRLSFPECSVIEQIGYGGLMAVPFLFIAILVFGFNRIRDLIESVGAE